MLIQSAEQVNELTRGNRLRTFPSATQGRERLFPFARPQTTLSRPLPEDPSFFIAGNCFARGMEKALRQGGFRVLSSSYSPELSGDAVEQFQRFNKFNTDAVINEIKWAVNQADNMDDALIQVGTEWVDMQLHFTVAGDAQDMRQRRKLFNNAYAPIREADVVVLIVGGRRQWFDSLNGIYLNDMPTRKMTALYPGRFELHTLDLAAAEERLQHAVDVVRAAAPQAHLLLVNSPVYQPMTLSKEDALRDQPVGKSLQHLAISNVLARNPGIDYLPAYEIATLSDFSHSYLPGSPNHTVPDLATRVAADLLAAGGVNDIRQARVAALGYGTALLRANMPQEAHDLLELVVARPDGGLVPGAERQVGLQRLYLQSLAMLGRQQDLAVAGLRTLRSFDVSGTDDDKDDELFVALAERAGAQSRFRSLVGMLSRPVAMYGDDADREFLQDFAARHGISLNQVAANTGGVVDARIVQLRQLADTGKHEEAVAQLDAINPVRTSLSRADRMTLHLIALKSGSKTQRANEILASTIALIEQEGANVRVVGQLCNHVRGRGSIAQIDTVLKLAAEFPELTDRVNRLVERRSFLVRKQCG